MDRAPGFGPGDGGSNPPRPIPLQKVKNLNIM